ncbi:MAG: carbonic anhydrase [Saprospiraceae bacterium]|nr:carbonic anhydrase [Saprospiraceae bacterium]
MSIDNSIAQNKESQDRISPDQAVELLKEGNKRFLADKGLARNYEDQIKATSSGQYPFAVVLSCIDSRVPAEIVFDQGIGDIFNVRVAGNFVNQDILGSIEYGCKVAGSKAVVVLGHASCGAVKGACDDVKLGHITGMLANLKPAVQAVEEDGDRTSANPEFVQKVVDMNIRLTSEAIRTQSDVLREMEENGEITIVGAMYDVKTGEVTFTDPPLA